jgi:hypothetical protein
MSENQAPDSELTRYLLQDQRYARISPEGLELMGREAANTFLDHGISLNEAISKLASAHQDINVEQIKRVVEFANNAVYLAKHDKDKTAGAASSYPQFELADTGRIVQALSDGARSTTITQTDADYSRPPQRKSKFSAAESETMLEELFHTEKKAELEHSKETAVQEVMDSKSSLVSLKNYLESSGEELDLRQKQASQEYYQAVKEHLLSGGNFADVVVAARSTGLDHEKIAEAIQPVVMQLMKDKVTTHQELKESMGGIEKVSHRVVNPSHQLVTAFEEVVSLSNAIKVASVGLSDVVQQISVVDKFIKEKPQLLQKTLNALYGGLAFLQDPKNRAEAIKLIAEIDEIPPAIAEAELDGNIVKLSKDGAMQKDWMQRALDMGKLIGMTDLAPVEDIYVTNFKPVPTMV